MEKRILSLKEFEQIKPNYYFSYGVAVPLAGEFTPYAMQVSGGEINVFWPQYGSSYGRKEVYYHR